MAAVTEVIPNFFDCFLGNSGKRLESAMLKCVEIKNAEGIVQELSDERMGEIPVRLFDEKEIVIFDSFSEKDYVIGCPPISFNFGRNGIQIICLPDTVEPDIGKSDIFLEQRRMAAPFGETMSENETVVGQANQVFGYVR